MRNFSFLAIVFCCLQLAAAELVFHFDFSGSTGKKSITDKTGNFTATVKTGSFAEEKGGLRIAPGAQIFVRDTRTVKQTSAMSVTAWLMKKSTPDPFPILTKGEINGPVEFAYCLGYKYPSFRTRNNSTVARRDYYSGIWYTGDGFGSGTKYAEPSWLKSADNLFINRSNKHESSGEWHHMAATFDRGTVRLYVDGKLAAEKIRREEENILPNDLPFCIGGYPFHGRTTLSQTADGLINDLRLYSGALTQTEINEIIAKETDKYTKEHFSIPGCTHLDALAPCGTYLPPDIAPFYDPWMTKTLPTVSAFEKKRIFKLDKGFIARPETRSYNGSPRLFVSGVPQYGTAAMVARYGMTSRAHQLRKYNMTIREYATGGINIISLGVTGKGFWKAPGVYDFRELDATAKLAIQANPDALFVFSILLDSPHWFMNKHPEELEQSYFRGKLVPEKGDSGSLGSELWDQEVEKMLTAVVRHVEAQDYGKRVIAYNPGGGESGEWYWPGAVYNRIPGYSKATTATFRKYLAETYKSDAALQKAWNDKKVTIKTAEAPSLNDWETSADGEFLKKSVERHIIDFRQYMCRRTILCQQKCAQIIKKACGGKKMVVLFTGYDLAVGSSKIFHSGLSSAWEILHVPEIDMTASLISYSDRREGQHGLDVNPFSGSHRLAGKIHWQEDDPRTHLAFKSRAGASQTPAETLNVLKRTIAWTVARNCYTWWRLFDMIWFHDDRIISTLQKGNEIIRSTWDADKSSVARAAMIFDEKSHFVLSKKSPLATSCGMPFYIALSTAGVACDYYYQNDMLNPQMPDYKLYFFVLSYHMPAAECKSIQKKLAKNNAVAVWLYAPGYFTDGYKKSTDNMKTLTGFDFKVEKSRRTVTAKCCSQNTRFRDLSSGSITTYPLFFPLNGEKIMTDGKGNTCAAITKMPGWTSIYSLMPLNRDFIRAVYRYAGIHVYSEDDDTFLVNRGYIALHASGKTRPRKITLDGKCDVTELFSGKSYGKGIDTIVIPGAANGDTFLFHLERK